MVGKFQEYKKFDLSQINKDVLNKWTKDDTFHKSLEIRKGKPSFVFYEGPPSANGLPGIHHIMARTIKDAFCRYKTAKGFHVKRKAGWDTHGLPVELGVEKTLGITKEDIGKSISVEEYNATCKKEVMKFTNVWEDITEKMGYWVDMEHPYVTYTSDYMETLWWMLKELYKKGLLYKGYSIQPYSPAAGTGLSSHELNLPGCYKDIKDTTAVALFKVIKNEKSDFLYKNIENDVSFLAWTTTPWTLLSNTALAVGKKINYVLIHTFNPYSGKPINVVIAENLIPSFFPEKNKDLKFEDYKSGDKKIPYEIISEFIGSDIEGIRYEQLLQYKQPETGDAFRVVTGDFVTTEDGTGIVHIAPSFGADDFRVAQQNGIGALTLVDKAGRFVDGVGEFSGKFVKKAFDKNANENTDEVDVDIVVKLKKEGKLFKAEKLQHSYPHCWRTDKPVLYYPLDSWFIKTTALKDRMIELNNTINWQPPSTGSGRFGKWLENLVDWNLSRSRYWGTPLPIWRTEDGNEEICIGSFEELKAECEKSAIAGFMDNNPLENFQPGDFSKENYETVNPHRPVVDDIILVSLSGKPMKREIDLIDVWFDSGAMPYAQMHYPFEHKDDFAEFYPADFIAEGVDQTRGWFFTLHALATMLFDSVAFKNIVSNGLVLDKNGNKMSKRLGNAVDPFETIEKHGSDPLRWYMMTNASPWDNLKFDITGIEEVRRKFFGTLYNTYSFFALYANVDNFNYSENEIAINDRPEIDRWVISLLHSLIKEVETHYSSYDPTKAGRAIQYFVTENLSNWYVRLNRKRFWGGEYDQNKIAAYQTLYTCLETVAKLMAPIAPFYSDQLFIDLNKVSKKNTLESIHLATFPKYDENNIDIDLEERMNMAQKISSMVLSLRRKESLKVRQPLNRIMIPVLDKNFERKVEAVKSIILTEVNIKNIEYLHESSGIITKKIRADFKKLGKRLGKNMKIVASTLNKFNQDDIALIEKQGFYEFEVQSENIKIQLDEVEITTDNIPGWLVANEGNMTIALDINITEDLRKEGLAREFINRIQNIRKESGFDVTDKIKIQIQRHPQIDDAIEAHKDYINIQTLSNSIDLVDIIENNHTTKVEIDTNIETQIKIEKVNN